MLGGDVLGPPLGGRRSVDSEDETVELQPDQPRPEAVLPAPEYRDRAATSWVTFTAPLQPSAAGMSAGRATSTSPSLVPGLAANTFPIDASAPDGSPARGLRRTRSGKPVVNGSKQAGEQHS